MQEKHINFFYHFSPDVFYREQKDVIAQNANEIISQAMGISSQKVVLIENKMDIPKFMSPDARGAYDFAENKIYINYYKYKNPYVILATIIHETTHIFLSILMQRNFHIDNINEITYEQYAFATQKVENQEMFERFKKFVMFLEITPKYLNLLRLDKLYYGRKSQPYFYNVDSSEVLAEYVSYMILCDIFKETNRTKDGLLLAYEMIEFLDYSYQGNVTLKTIYTEENATDKSLKRAFSKLKLGNRYNCNMFKMESYDINSYEKIWNRMSDEYKKLRSIVNQELEVWNFIGIDHTKIN